MFTGEWGQGARPVRGLWQQRRGSVQPNGPAAISLCTGQVLRS